MAQRAMSVEALDGQPFDLLVVGGGIIGVGIARDAALRGFRVALVEQNDLSSGTTSRPTRLIHGGLRYLEMYDFGLVRSDLHEREVLLHVAPHLVFPLPFLMPMYRPSFFYESKLRAGMELYDVLSFDKSLPNRRWLTRDETLETEPTINPDGLHGSWRFFDAQVPYIERLVVENALDAAREGATILTHARAERFIREPDGRVAGAVVRDVLSGREVDLRARVTVNASGPWLDMSDGEVRAGRRPLLRLTKGVHLVTPRGTRNAVILFAHSDGRLFFVVPWIGQSLVGTTDTDYSGDPTDAAADRSDVSYLVSESRQAFPRAPFDEVHYTWAGVRALVRVEGVKEGQVSRKHAVLDHEKREGVPGIVSVVGGKITAYRAIGDEVCDLVSRKLGRTTRGYTDLRKLPGGHLSALPVFLEQELWPRARGLGLTHEQAAHLADLYGTLAIDVLDRVERDRSLAARVCPHHPTIAAQFARAVEVEWAATLGDTLLRRTALGFEPHQGLDCLDNAARVMGDLLGWDAAEREAQMAAYRAEIEPMRRFSTEPARLPEGRIPVTA